MPWCDMCSVYHAPTAVLAGTCPNCGKSVERDGTHGGLDDRPSDEERTVGQSAPWHFWIVVVALVAYIGWRILDVAIRIF